MKKLLSVLITVLLLAVAVIPAYAQLGQTDVSSFTVQNVGGAQATVTITFVAEDGTQYTPGTLDRGKSNPLFLNSGQSAEIYVPGIPSGGLPAGRYAVIIASDQPIVATSNISGSGVPGTPQFTGTYSGMDQGDVVFYLPTVSVNFYGFWSLMTVQNVGQAATDIDVEIKCTNGAEGTFHADNVAAGAAVSFDTKATLPTGFTAATKCDGGATVYSKDPANNANAGQPVVAVALTRDPSRGNTTAYSGVISGAKTLYVSGLYNNYYGWNANLSVVKLAAGNTRVTVAYTDGQPNSICDLTDALPVCSLYMPNAHTGGAKMFGATITSNNVDVAAVIQGGTLGTQAFAYNAVPGGTAQASAPAVYKYYYGWRSSITCQNLSGTASTLHVAYDGYPGNAYNTASVGAGATKEILNFGEAFLPNGYVGGIMVNANAAGAVIACNVNFNHPANEADPGSFPGDWSSSYNAFNQ
jgi:hypothetical protein